MTQEERWYTLKFILKGMLELEAEPQLIQLYTLILEYMEKLETSDEP